MNTPALTFVTFDMRGLKAALVARARAQRVSVSVLVRDAVARHLGLVEAEFASEAVASASAAAAQKHHQPHQPWSRTHASLIDTPKL
jgi:hypothetical protein